MLCLWAHLGLTVGFLLLLYAVICMVESLYLCYLSIYLQLYVLGDNTRDVFYVRKEVDLMKTEKANAYIMYIFGKIELLSIHATKNYFKMHCCND